MATAPVSSIELGRKNFKWVKLQSCLLGLVAFQVRNFDAGVAALLALERLDLGVDVHLVTLHSRVGRKELLATAAGEAAAADLCEAGNLVRFGTFVSFIVRDADSFGVIFLFFLFSLISLSLKMSISTRKSNKVRTCKTA